MLSRSSSPLVNWTRVLLWSLTALLFAFAGCADDPAVKTSDPVDKNDIGYSDVPANDAPSGPTCNDGLLNGDETDIDCGGPECGACEVGSVCVSSRDCDTGVCRQGVCAPSNCDDGILNGDETDIDCGGTCGPCATGRACNQDGECVSGECVDNVCHVRSCDDVECGATEACYRGNCYDSCDDVVTCADDSRCFEGHCAPFECDGVPCHAEEFCVRGVCYPPCGDSEEEACPALDFVTEAAVQITATSALLRGALIELPIEPVSDHGFCWHTSSEPGHQRGQCHSLGEPQTLGGFSFEATDLSAGRMIYVRAFVIDQTDTFYANEITLVTAAPAPTGVTASQGTEAAYVEVSWLRPPGATGFVVYRDGEQIATAGESTLGHQDTGAQPSGEPGAPTALTATQGDHTDRVEIGWSLAATSDNAARHEYTVTAVYPGATSPPSEPATGHRATSPVLSYELQIDGGSWFDVGQDLSFADTGAPQGTIEPGTATATQGEHGDRVEVELSGASRTNGAAVSYRVRAVTAQGSGAASDETTGYRSVGALSYQWQRSAADADGGYTDLGGANDTSYADLSAPGDGSGRYYRTRVSAPGASSQNSIAARGFRAIAPTIATDTVSGVGATGATFHGTISALGTPTASIHGFCWGVTPSPATDDGPGTTCQSLGAPDQVGAFTLTAGGLAAGTTYYMRAYAANNAGTVYGSDISFVTPPAVPSGLSASDGTSPNYVRVTWNPAAGATSYRVFRDGQLIDTISATTYDDTGAGAGGLHQAPQLGATLGDHVDRVALSWSPPTAANGATHTYTVVALRDGVASQESGSDTGYRSAFPVLNYELRIDGGEWANIGAGTSHDDTDAPQGTIAPGTTAATDGTSIAHVALTLSGAGAAPGASRTYHLRAVSVSGTGAASSGVPGFRGVGNVAIQWQRSSGDSNADYTNLAGATAATHNDTSAPASGAGRYYRATVSADGAQSQFSNANRGFRAALPAVLTVEADPSDGQAALTGDITNLGAPNPSAHGFCWGTSLNPSTNLEGDTECVDLGAASSTGEFTHTVNDANLQTLYYVRAFATTNAGTTYGANLTFEIQCGPIPNFVGGHNGPNLSAREAGCWRQCAGHRDTTATNEVPTAWGSTCVGQEYDRVIVACGADPSNFRYIVVEKNVFREGLTGFPESGLISASLNHNGVPFTVDNRIWAETNNNPNNGRSWWGGGSGCGETNTNLTVNNSCTMEASNCFGQNLGTNPRYLWVYVQ